MVKRIKDAVKNLNIVIGCPIGCRYCYARINNNRFRAIPDFSKPVFFEKKLRLFNQSRKSPASLGGGSLLAIR